MVRLIVKHHLTNKFYLIILLVMLVLIAIILYKKQINMNFLITIQTICFLFCSIFPSVSLNKEKQIGFYKHLFISKRGIKRYILFYILSTVIMYIILSLLLIIATIILSIHFNLDILKLIEITIVRISSVLILSSLCILITILINFPIAILFIFLMIIYSSIILEYISNKTLSVFLPIYYFDIYDIEMYYLFSKRLYFELKNIFYTILFSIMSTLFLYKKYNF